MRGDMDEDWMNGNSVGGGGGGGDDGVVPGDYLLAKLLEKAISGASFERKSAAQDLLEAFHQTWKGSSGRVEDEEEQTSAANLINIIDKLATDPDHGVRAAVLDQLPHIALFCHEEGPHLDYVLPQHILPHIVRLLTDKFTQVRKCSQSGLLLLVDRGIIAPSQVEELIIPVVLEYTTPAAHEDYRTEIAQFMSKLAPLLGKEITIKAYLDRFCYLCHDKLFQVRRVCASSIGEIAAVVGPILTEKVLLAHFHSLCKDEIWGVRKGCAETITVFSNCCSPSNKKGILTDLFVILLEDSSRWVRIAACQSFGPFITTFLSEDTPPPTPIQILESETEKTFFANYNHLDFENLGATESTVPCNSIQTSATTNCNAAAVIPRCSSLVNSNDSASFSFLQKIKQICKETATLDQNQNTRVPDGVDFTSIPMDVDEQEEHISSSTSSEEPANKSLSFEEKRKIAYEKNQKDEEEMKKQEENIVVKEERVVMEEEENGNVEDVLDKTVPYSSSTDNNQLTEENKATAADYDTFLYWRDPIPELDLDVEMPDSSQPTIGQSQQQLVKMEEGESAATSNGGAWKNEIDEIYSSYETGETAVHRSYMNLFSVSNKEERDANKESKEMKKTSADQFFEQYETFKLDSFEDEDSDEQLSTSFPFGNEYASQHWASRHSRPKLLSDLPKSSIGIGQDIVPEVLLQHFTSLCQSNKDHQTIDTEFLSFCVYNLPAVVLTLGPQNWSLIRDSYEALACSMQWKIRYTLASSLHEIASILGPELSERDLVPFYNATTKDLDEVRIGLLRNLASFIKTLGSEAQRECLKTMDRFAVTENSRNWRFRLEFADQLQKLGEIYGPEEIFNPLCPFIMDLIVDRVSEVRKKALSVIPYLVTRLNYTYSSDQPHNPSLVREFLQHLIKTLGQSDVWVRRQAFASLAGQLVEIGAMSPHQFANDIVPILVELSKDRVPNVRLKVAQSITLNIIGQDYFADPSHPSTELLLTTLERLQNDKDKDVRDCSKIGDDVEEDELNHQQAIAAEN